MDELYGIHSSSTSYPLQLQENMVAPAADYHGFRPPVTTANFPVFGSSDQFFCGSSVSDDASIVAEMQRGSGGSSEEEVSSAIRAKIASHPLYPKLLQAYIDCQKVGAPPEMTYLLDEIWQDRDFSKRSNVVACSLGADPELDEFMESYCDILMKYKADLSKHFDEATTFLNDIEAQFNSLCNGETVGSSDEDASGEEEVEVEAQDSSRAHEERELKDKLLRKYSGYISTLRQEFSKKKKKGKLPKEARQILLNWWNVHYKWPYPTEADKAALADTTGLDQKQINNWFINQRKRHWKPSENMQFSVVDSLYGTYFMNE